VRVGAGAEGAEARWPDDPLAYVQAFPGLWDAFRTEAVTATMAGLHRTARRVRPEAVVSAAVFADAEDALRGRFQDWEAWVRDGIVDLVAPMAYSPDARVFEAQILRAAALDPRRVWAGLGVYQDTFEGAVGKALAARSLGVGGLALFSYDWAAGPEG